MNEEQFDQEMRKRVEDARDMLDWNETVSFSRRGVQPLLDLAIEALDKRKAPRLVIEGGWLVQARPDGTAVKICMIPDPEAHPEMFEGADDPEPEDDQPAQDPWSAPVVQRTADAPAIAGCVGEHSH